MYSSILFSVFHTTKAPDDILGLFYYKNMRKIWKEFWKAVKEINKDDQTESESYGLQILEEMFKSSKSEMLISPISGTYYIKWEGIYAIIKDCRVQIINGRYFYDIAIVSKRSDIIREKFICAVEERRRVMEKEILEKTKRSLSAILEEIRAQNNLITTNNLSHDKI